MFQNTAIKLHYNIISMLLTYTLQQTVVQYITRKQQVSTFQYFIYVRLIVTYSPRIVYTARGIGDAVLRDVHRHIVVVGTNPV